MSIPQPAPVVLPTPSTPSPRRRRWPRYLALALVAILLLASGGGYAYLRRSLPQLTGELNLPGLAAPVTVYRDEWGVPHIEALNEPDLFRAQGYVTAQDRLWQMDLSRRAASGQLAEVMGESLLSTDKYFRTLSLRRSAEASVEIYSPGYKANLQAYTDGINAFMQQSIDKGTLPIEFTLLGYKPTPWTLVDSAVIGKFMAYDMNGGNLSAEIFQYQLRKQVGDSMATELKPTYPSDGVTIMNAAEWTGAPAKSSTALLPPDQSQIDLSGLLAAAYFPQEGIGSNNWVVSGKLTASGKPLLANDPHLTLRTPSIWYQTHLVIKGQMNVIGVIFPGAPGIVIGHNDKIAWGMTNTDPDVIDTYIEQRNPANPNQFMYMGKWEDAKVYNETIKVKGKPEIAYPVTVTRHGPIISEVTGGEKDRPKEALSMQWTALDPSREPEALLGFDRAQNWQDFREALKLFRGPTQNFVFASVDGTIAYHAGGVVPIRAQGDGLYPVPGTTDAYEWKGFIPFDQMPEVVNPAKGFIATANNKVVDDAYPYFLTDNWTEPYRATRITEVLGGGSGFTADQMQKLQADSTDLRARTFLPDLITAVKTDGLSDVEQQALALVKSWNYVDGAEQGAPLLFHGWWEEGQKALFEPKMGAELYSRMESKGLIADELLRQAIKGNPNTWVKAAGGLQQLATDSFKKAVAAAVTLQGKNPANWRWGDFHKIGPAHPIGDQVAILGLLLNPKFLPVSGASETVGAMGYNKQTGRVTLAAPWRQVVDLGDVTGNSRDVLTPGQSGHPLSSWYTSQQQMHHDGQMHPQLMKPELYSKGKKLTLKP